MSSNRMIIKNEDTNKFYSLAENTLIHLPNSSNENIILHGIEQGEDVQLDVSFTKYNHICENHVNTVNGKVFTQKIREINTLNVKEVKGYNFEPVYTWYYTNMTSNTAPSPLVASASSQYSTGYQAWKAFSDLENNTSNRWRTANDLIDAHIEIDFGKAININRVKITSVNDPTTIVGTPQNYKIMGSLDGLDYYIMSEFTSENWSINEERVFSFQSNSARYVRLLVNRMQGEATLKYLNLGKILYGYKEVN